MSLSNSKNATYFDKATHFSNNNRYSRKNIVKSEATQLQNVSVSKHITQHNHTCFIRLSNKSRMLNFYGFFSFWTILFVRRNKFI